MLGLSSARPVGILLSFKMKPFLFAAAVLASSAMAQTTSACAADYIVEACLSSENAKLGNCQHNDYECKCTQWQNILTYGNRRRAVRAWCSSGQRPQLTTTGLL